MGAPEEAFTRFSNGTPWSGLTRGKNLVGTGMVWHAKHGHPFLKGSRECHSRPLSPHSRPQARAECRRAQSRTSHLPGRPWGRV